MAKFPLSVVLIVSFSTVLFCGGVGWALDESGCLTCHQYPGLVSVDKNHSLKVLHIDESRYAASVHGRFPCISCHTTIVKVPHTGNRHVDCSTACHQGSDAKPLPPDYPLTDFHKTEQSFIKGLEDKSSCGVCHFLYPHRADTSVRGFLNMHIGFMTCEVCHLKKDKLYGVTYQWNDSENARFSGEPFGTFFNPTTRKTKKPMNFISRIAIYTTQKSQRHALVNTRDTAEALTFKRKRLAMTDEEISGRLRFFHRDIEKKAISVACDQCHSTPGILDYAGLGFDWKKQWQLENLNLKGLVTKYKTFYLPRLFDN